MVVRNMDKIIPLMITAVIKVKIRLTAKELRLLVTVSVTALIGKAVTAS